MEGEEGSQEGGMRGAASAFGLRLAVVRGILRSEEVFDLSKGQQTGGQTAAERPTDAEVPASVTVPPQPASDGTAEPSGFLTEPVVPIEKALNRTRVQPTEGEE